MINIYKKFKSIKKHITMAFMTVLMGLTYRRNTTQNLDDSRKNWKILTVSGK